jgi:alkylation response protein AidB-like acyl-CoA dehydrogenase
MNFDYLEEHELLRDSARNFLSRNDPLTLLRSSPPLQPGQRLARLRANAAQGWAGILVEENCGGAGLTILDAMVVAEELGRFADPWAFAAHNATCDAVARWGSDAQRADILAAMGEGRVIVARSNRVGKAQFAGPEIPLVAEPHPAGWCVRGTVSLIQDADIADFFLVDGAVPGGQAEFLIATDTEGVVVREIVGMDVSRRHCDVTFNSSMIPRTARLGNEQTAVSSIKRQACIGAVLTAADSVGVASRLLEMTVAYTKERIAFGKPVAAFQAVKHRCADMLVQVETARVATWYAAIALRDARPDMHAAASIAKFFATEAGSLVASQALQLHGGLGMTWEHDLHFFYKRAKANELLWGSSASHREHVADALAL